MEAHRRDRTSEPGAADRPAAGLTGAEAAARLARDGPNTLPPAPSPPAWKQLAAQVSHFFALLLWAAGGLAFVAGMPQLGGAIFVVILVNGVFAFAQEHRAERAAQQLRRLIPRRVNVLRDGRREEIDAAGLVAGDVVFLSGGDGIPADMTVLAAESLRVDESTLTGESLPVAVDASSAVSAGTFVVSGEGTAVVEATGGRTRLAAIARLTRAGRRPRSPLARELDRVVRIVALVALAVGGGFFGIALLVGTPASDGFLFAIGVTVALVPEGLLPTVTLSLAMGAQRMAGRHALVRRLESVETLGSTTFICTDKTGTLTRNEMSVREIWMPGGSFAVAGEGYAPAPALVPPPGLAAALGDLATAAIAASDGRAVEREGTWLARGDPMEAALDTFARRLGVDVAAGDRDRVVLRRFPFDPVRRRMSVVTPGWMFTKGAPEAVFGRSASAPGADGAAHEMAGRGLRVLAIARRPMEAAPATADEAERDLELLGLVGMEDPPRAGARDAVAACRRAGIAVAMVTGDHPGTAEAIARETGLLLPGSPVFLGVDLPAGEAILGALVDRDGAVICRVTPEDKLRIARALRARGHVIAMTGDGVNDGPALQEADVGIAMGRTGTDVAREAADLVLLDDDFATIVVAIEEGRATFANIRRFLTYHLTDNVAELTPFVVWALSGGRFPLALGVLQILCLDIGTDLLPALALGSEAPNERVLRRPVEGRHLMDARLLRRVFALLGPVEALVEMTAFLAVMLAAGWRPGDSFPGGETLMEASGAAFAAVVVGQAANAFACRSTTFWPGALGWRTNRFLLVAVAVELTLLLAFLFTGPVADLLDQAPPPPAGLAVALLAAPAVLIADATHKRRRRRLAAKRGAARPAGG
ncbi:MAG: cation-transporting P-type ATPase [Chloroflexi bacterium]|nr:cation-transporting P-type ATPase [Chloroflexota bacterium]